MILGIIQTVLKDSISIHVPKIVLDISGDFWYNL